MTVHDTLKNNGGWSVELLNPVHYQDRVFGKIDFNPPEFGTTIRWGRGAIASVFALMEELSGTPQAVLMKVTQPDINRVMAGFLSIVPEAIRKDIETGVRPIVADEVLFPMATGIDPIKESEQAVAQPRSAPPQQQPDDDSGMRSETPIMRRIN